MHKPNATLKTEYLRFPGPLPTRWQVFYAIISNGQEFTSGESLARKFGISRPMVWKAVQSLIDDGFPIEAVKKKGYRVQNGQGTFSFNLPTVPQKIMDNLKTRFLGRTIFYVWQTGSTNDDAKHFAEDPQVAPDGTLVMAETQTSGKGRLERRWFSPPGGIFMSMIMRPRVNPEKVPGLALVTGYSLALTVSHFLNDRNKSRVSLKWPNDVLIGGKKVAGILCEMRAEIDQVSHVIIGVGINANLSIKDFRESFLPEDVRTKVTSLETELGHTFDKNLFIADFLNRFEPFYLEFVESGLERFLPEIDEILAFKGKKVVISNTSMPASREGSTDARETSGVLEGLDSAGRLLLRSQTGIIKVPAGDVSLREEHLASPGL